MRRIAALSAPLLLATLALAGCGSSPGASASGSRASAKVAVSGTFGQAPKVTIPHAHAGTSLVVHTVIHGTGAKVNPKAQAVVGDYAVYLWRGDSATLVQSTFKTAPALFSGALLPGLTDALQDKTIGSRVVAVIPPKDGYGSGGNSQAGIKGTDTLVFVVDLLHVFANDASATGKQVSSGGHGLPTITPASGGQGEPAVAIPHAAAPGHLVTRTLIQGSGPRTAKGQLLVVQYVGVVWRTGKVFDSSWQRGAPFGFLLDEPDQVITGWNDGLTGQPVGSRVLLVIPPKDGYGSKGQPQAGIKGTDTLVFVVDILGAFSPGTTAA